MTPPRLVLAVLSLILFLAPLRAEQFTLTDKQGRTLKADVLSVEDGKARIKRDDGRQFDLPISTLSDEDQKKLRDWAAVENAKPKPIPTGALDVITSRAKFDSKRVETPETYQERTTYSDGSTTTETKTRYLITTTEQWGYSITVTNRSIDTITGLRAEYTLFTTPGFSSPTSGSPSAGTSGTLTIGTLKSRGSTILKTSAVPLVKAAYKGTSPKPAGGQLSGVVVRIYRDQELVLETASSDKLLSTIK